MLMQKKWAGVLFSLLFALWLTGCSSGGGGDDAPAATITGTAEGVWTGMTGDGRTVWGAVPDDDTYYFLYSLPGQPSEFAGMVQGHGRSQNGAFTSSDGFDFHVHILDPPGLGGPVTVTGSYLPQQTLGGRLTYDPLWGGGGSATFTSTYLPAYEEAPNLAQVVGTYTGDGSVGFSPMGSTMTVSTSGEVCFNSVTLVHFFGCQVTNHIGTISPRTQGNLYDVVLVNQHGFRISRNPDVYSETTTYTGIAFFDSATNRLHVLAPGFIFVGTKQ